MDESEIRKQIAETQAEIDQIEVRQRERSHRFLVLLCLGVLYVLTTIFFSGSWLYLAMVVVYASWFIFGIWLEWIPIPDLRKLRILGNRPKDDDA